jgi:hypothetical protein
MAGLYKMLAKKGHSYKVKSPTLIKLYLVFFIESLYYNLNDSLPSQANAPLSLVNITADNKYKV